MRAGIPFRVGPVEEYHRGMGRVLQPGLPGSAGGSIHRARGLGCAFQGGAWVALPFDRELYQPEVEGSMGLGRGQAALLRDRSRALSLCPCFCGPVWWPAEEEPVVCIGRQEMFRMSVGSCPVSPPRLIQGVGRCCAAGLCRESLFGTACFHCGAPALGGCSCEKRNVRLGCHLTDAAQQDRFHECTSAAQQTLAVLAVCLKQCMHPDVTSHVYEHASWHSHSIWQVKNRHLSCTCMYLTTCRQHDIQTL